MSWLNPWAFLLLLLLPVWLRRASQKRLSGQRLSSLNWLSELPKSPRQRLVESWPLLRLMALVALILALARPVEVIGKKRESREGIAIQFVVDRSSSMRQQQAYKGQPSTRLEAVKAVLVDFIRGADESMAGRPNDLIGLVTFARYGDTVCPLVRNIDAVAKLCQSISLVQYRSEDGTAIGDALLLAASRLHKAGEDLRANQERGIEAPIDLKSKVVVLLTDGQNNAGQVDPVEAADKARDWGVKVYTIGLKSESRSFLSRGRVDEALLQDLARRTGGQYFPVSGSEELEAVAQAIDELEKSAVETPEFIQGRELFPWAAGLSLLLLALETVLGASWLRVVS